MAAISKIVDYGAIAEVWGWEPCNAGEFKVIRVLRALGISSHDVEQQFRLGPYRIDFAFVRERIAIEADGFPHTTRKGKQRDRMRDKKLASWGWETIRVDIEDHDDEYIKRQLSPIIFTIVRNRK